MNCSLQAGLNILKRVVYMHFNHRRILLLIFNSSDCINIRGGGTALWHVVSAVNAVIN